MVAVEGRRIEPAVRRDWPAVPAEFRHVFRHRSLLSAMYGRILTPIIRVDRPDCQKMAFVLLTIYIQSENHRRKRP
jgi:hypothetical protein